MFTSLQLNPLRNVNIEIEATYTSPAGRNHYSLKHTYPFLEFEKILITATNLINSRQTREYQIKLERSKLSDSLRYDVFKRDNFRCQICGSSSHDGVKLHVDHIIPVSKGGKTVVSNLRTLCDRCNMEKSNKIEQ